MEVSEISCVIVAVAVAQTTRVDSNSQQLATTSKKAPLASSLPSSTQRLFYLSRASRIEKVVASRRLERLKRDTRQGEGQEGEGDMESK